MAAPSFIQEAESPFSSSTTPQVTGSFAVQTADILLSLAGAGDANTSAVTPTGGGLTWTQQESVGTTGASARVTAHTTAATSSTSFAVSYARVGNANLFGGNVLTFRASDGVGAAESTHIAAGSAAATLNILTTQANSAIGVIVIDWNAVDGASRTWRANAGALTELTYFRDSANYTVYIGYHADAGPVNTYAVGLTAPATMRYSIAAVEILGTAGGGVSTPPSLVMAPRAPTY